MKQMHDDIVLSLVNSIHRAVTLVPDDNDSMRVEVRFDESRRSVYRIFFYTGDFRQWFAETWSDDAHGYLRVFGHGLHEDDWVTLIEGLFRWAEYPEGLEMDLNEDEARVGRHIRELNRTLEQRYGTNRDETIKSIREFNSFVEGLVAPSGFTDQQLREGNIVTLTDEELAEFEKWRGPQS